MIIGGTSREAWVGVGTGTGAGCEDIVLEGDEEAIGGEGVASD